jgi:hypothetical protein
MNKYARFRDRGSLKPGDVIPVAADHEVATPAIEAEGGLRRYAGAFVAAVHTATAQARGNTLCYLAGFGTYDAAARAVAEVIASRLRNFGRDFSPAEVEALARRSSGRFRPEWGGPVRRFDRLSFMLHYGRVYRPLDAVEQADDAAAFEAYMAKRAEEEAAARARAEQARLDELAAKRAERDYARREAERQEREAREAAEDRHLVSRLIFRAQDRASAGIRYRVDWRPIVSHLRRLGVFVQIKSALDALCVTGKPWFVRKCELALRYDGRRGVELNNLRWKIRRAAARELEIAWFYKRIPSHIAAWAPRYVARRRARLQAMAAAA